MTVVALSSLNVVLPDKETCTWPTVTVPLTDRIPVLMAAYAFVNAAETSGAGLGDGASVGVSLADVPAEEEFAVVITRRGADGVHEPVAIVDDEALVERAIRRAA